MAATEPAKKRQRSVSSRSLTFGGDFSGIDMPAFCLKALGVNADHLFASDKSPACRKLLRTLHQPRVVFDDVLTRDTTALPTCDIYTAGFPCQAFSTAGTRQGISHQVNGLLGLNAVQYILTKEPRVAIMENVVGFPLQHKLYMSLILELLNDKYWTSWKVLNTRDFGLPQNRERWYLVAIHKNHLKSDFRWPASIGRPILLSQIIVPLPVSDFKVEPEKESQRVNVRAAYTNHMAQGISNPFTTSICIDAAASKSWSSSRVEETPTLTKTRCQQFGYWVSSKGGPLSIEEMMHLQGLSVVSCDWQSSGVTRSQFAGCLGNAMSLNVLCYLLPEAMEASQLVTPQRAKALRRRATALFPSLP